MTLQSFWKRYKPYILQIALALAAGGLASLLGGGTDLYGELVKLPLSPPPWVFPVVWTVLYVLMGLAAGIIQASGDRDRPRAMTAYYVQLGINVLWPLLFFRLRLLTLAAVWLALLVVAVFVTRRRFGAISSTAGNLLWPYLLWCLFALYLNIGFAVLN